MKTDVTELVEPQFSSLGDEAAQSLATETKSVPQMESITPRWLVHLLDWVPVEAGVYRRNRVTNEQTVTVESDCADESLLPETFIDYETRPREYRLKAAHTIVNVHTRISDLYSGTHDQITQQLRLTIEAIKEHQENELINSPEYGLIANVADKQRISTIAGAPTPDDLDAMIARAWKEPGFFLTHPEGIAAFGRECTRRGVPPATVSLFGSQFLTWRGIPIIPSDKVPVTDGRTNFLLIRTGEARRGVVGLYQPGLTGEQGLGLSVKFMGIDRRAIASYLMTLYSSLAILTDDAVALLEGAEVNRFHDYASTERR
ncbi:family 2A encapsulin nanocompartment shell protein [Nocardia sp. NPDC051570]|uniref:family 2A encapsulin nanocompartment shell protein n=1 Tax=Nocardia sp. NPDC051570 TaxID=3364324 RepID=UPI0037B426FD